MNKEIKEYLDNKDHLSNSEINTYLDCQTKWYQQYVKGNREYNIHFDFGIMGHKVLETRQKPNKELTDFDKFTEAFKIEDFDLYFDSIFKELDELLEGYEIIDREITFNIEGIKGIIDLLLYDKEKDEYIVYDYKFSNSFRTVDDILLDQQLYIYGAAVSILKNIDINKIRVGYITIPKRPINNPTILSSGKLSKSKSQNTTYDAYINKINELGLNIEDYEDFLIELKNKTILKRVETKINNDFLVRVLKNIELVKKDMRKGYILENWNSYKCKTCPMKDICKKN